MRTDFRRIDLLRAALQVKGATPFEIEELMQGVTKMGGTKFDAWNQPLDDEGMQLLRSVLGKNGVAFADIVIGGFQELMTKHYQISGEEIQRALKARLGGLN
jgi:hypothetical protein